MNPDDFLKKTITDRLGALDQDVTRQNDIIDSTLRSHVTTLEKQYNIERKYAESAPGDHESKVRSVAQLNKKYALKINELQGQVEPFRSKVQAEAAEKRQGIAELQKAATLRLQYVRSLVADGVISDPAVAMQQQLKAVGLEMPISAFKQRTEDPVKQITSEIREVDNALKMFVSGKDQSGKWFSSTKVRVKETDPVTGLVRKRDVTDEEGETYKSLIERHTQLQTELTKNVRGKKSAYLLSDAMNQVSGKAANPLVAFLQKQPVAGGEKTAKEEKVVTRDMAVQLLQEAKGDKAEARKLARERGYRF